MSNTHANTFYEGSTFILDGCQNFNVKCILYIRERGYPIVLVKLLSSHENTHTRCRLQTGSNAQANTRNLHTNATGLWQERKGCRRVWNRLKCLHNTVGIYQCQNISMLEYINVRIYQCWHISMLEYINVRIYQCQQSNVRIYHCQNISMLVEQYYNTSMLENINVSKPLFE